jgi:acetylornithine deacetylase/succinyl-diaminopimelate desuccinylase-like protein
MREAGLDPAIDTAGSVVARVGDGPGAPIAVAAHLDTVFAGIETIEVRRDGDVLHAPGIGDNSLGVAALLALARRATSGDRPLLLAATVGEEGFGNLRGARHLVDTESPAEFIALEGGGVGELVTAGVGSARYSIEVRAPGGHSWRDRDHPSAVHVLIGLLERTLADAGTASANVGALHGGAGINVLAPEAIATLEFRDPDTSRLDVAAERLAAAAADLTSDGVSVSLTELGRRPGGATPPEHPLVRDAIEAARAAGLGAPRTAESSTDANAALGKGIPAITVGLCHSRDAHTPDESVDLSLLGPSLRALHDLVTRRTRRV